MRSLQKSQGSAVPFSCGARSAFDRLCVQCAISSSRATSLLRQKPDAGKGASRGLPGLTNSLKARSRGTLFAWPSVGWDCWCRAGRRGRGGSSPAVRPPRHRSPCPWRSDVSCGCPFGQALPWTGSLWGPRRRLSNVLSHCCCCRWGEVSLPPALRGAGAGCDVGWGSRCETLTAAAGCCSGTVAAWGLWAPASARQW